MNEMDSMCYVCLDASMKFMVSIQDEMYAHSQIAVLKGSLSESLLLRSSEKSCLEI